MSTVPELLAEISAILGVDVVEVRRREYDPGHLICSEAPCAHRRVATVDRCSPPCDRWRPARGRRWEIRVLGQDGRPVRVQEFDHADIRSPGRLARVAVTLGARPGRRYTVEDGRTLALAMHRFHEAAASPAGAL